MNQIEYYNGMRYKDGYYSIQGIKIYYKTFESPNADKNLICLHGGPGAAHNYLLPLAELSKRGITVLFYDQFGSGMSEEPTDLSKFSIEYGAEELEELRKTAFGDKVFVMGSSFGGQVALQHALKYQKQLRGLITTGGVSNIPFMVKEMNRLKDEMPEQIRTTLKKYEDSQDYQNPEYLRAVELFYKKHLLRLEKWPEEFLTAWESTQQRRVYNIINGPNEFTVTGAMKDWNITDRLHEIKVPTLVLTGKYDEVTSNVAELIHKNIQNSTLVMFENSSHMPMWEEKELYLKIVEEFIKRAH